MHITGDADKYRKERTKGRANDAEQNIDDENRSTATNEHSGNTTEYDTD